MKQVTLILICFISYSIKAQVDSISTFCIGEVLQIHSAILNEERIINIYLPNGYKKDSTKKYPVIYLLDGSVNEDFIHITGLVQFCSFPWVHLIPETIVVGIANVDRERDFTFPTTIEKDKKNFPTTGSSQHFIEFIKSELQPLIESNYSVDSVKTIIGQSLGGLLATEILFKEPDLFDNYMIISPSLWWDKESLLKIENKILDTPKNIYIGVGKEGKIMVNDAKQLRAKLKSSLPSDRKLYFNYFKSQNHGNILHLAIYDGFEQVFHQPKD